MMVGMALLATRLCWRADITWSNTIYNVWNITVGVLLLAQHIVGKKMVNIIIIMFGLISLLGYIAI